MRSSPPGGLDGPFPSVFGEIGGLRFCAWSTTSAIGTHLGCRVRRFPRPVRGLRNALLDRLDAFRRRKHRLRRGTNMGVFLIDACSRDRGGLLTAPLVNKSAASSRESAYRAIVPGPRAFGELRSQLPGRCSGEESGLDWLLALGIWVGCPVAFAGESRAGQRYPIARTAMRAH